jgi:hypothetical protein
VALLFNPPDQKAALPNAAATLLEVTVHVALSQMSAGGVRASSSSSYAAAAAAAAAGSSPSSSHAVSRFLSALLGDSALAARLMLPLIDNSHTEVAVVVEYARKVVVGWVVGWLFWLISCLSTVRAQLDACLLWFWFWLMVVVDFAQGGQRWFCVVSAAAGGKRTGTPLI